MADEPTSDRPTEPDALPPSNPIWREMLEGTSSEFESSRGITPAHPEQPALQAVRLAVRRAGRSVHAHDRPWSVGQEPQHLRFLLQAARDGAAVAPRSSSACCSRTSGARRALAESMGAEAFRRLLERFYHRATDVLLARDAILDKFVGDEVVALFIPALAGADHARRALDAARDLLKVTGHGQAADPWVATRRRRPHRSGLRRRRSGTP